GVLRATPKLGESFGDLYPEVAAEWHPTRNADLKPTDVKPGSQKKVWWQCHQGHEWRVAPAHRRRGERCPECAAHQSSIMRSTPKAGRSLAELYPEIAAATMWCKTAVIEAYATAISKAMQLMESVVVDRVLPISLNGYAVPALRS